VAGVALAADEGFSPQVDREGDGRADASRAAETVSSDPPTVSGVTTRTMSTTCGGQSMGSSGPVFGLAVTCAGTSVRRS
jgi:hypothetical protein